MLNEWKILEEPERPKRYLWKNTEKQKKSSVLSLLCVFSGSFLFFFDPKSFTNELRVDGTLSERESQKGGQKA